MNGCTAERIWGCPADFVDVSHLWPLSVMAAVPRLPTDAVAPDPGELRDDLTFEIHALLRDLKRQPNRWSPRPHWREPMGVMGPTVRQGIAEASHAERIGHGLGGPDWGSPGSALVCRLEESGEQGPGSSRRSSRRPLHGLPQGSLEWDPSQSSST